MKNKFFIVLQIGARHNYQIPLYFAQRNSLITFYTDFHSSHNIFKIFKIFPRFFFFNRLNRISNRKLPFLLPNKLVKDNLLYIFFRGKSSIHKYIFKRVRSDNFGHANAIYTNIINDDIQLLLDAKKKGLYIVHEVIINPNINQIYQNELKKFPSLGTYKNKNLNNKDEQDKDLIKLNLVDKVLVPSEYIFKEVIKKGISFNKISIVEPYMPSRNLLEIKTNPKKGRILFVGEISMMKGIHYFAEACRILKTKKIFYEFIAVGKCSLDLKNPLLKGPKYLGYLNKKDLIKVFSCSDVFVLPSLSDAFPASHLEAMAFGLPVILTNSCGSIIDDGKNGYIINTGEPDILANKIMEIVENRSLRKKFSYNAKKKVQDYNLNDFYKKLDEALD